MMMLTIDLLINIATDRSALRQNYNFICVLHGGKIN